MKQRLLSFLLLAAIAISFTACITTDDAFGTDLIPEDQKTTVSTYTFDNIPLYTGTIDSIPTLSHYDFTNIFGSINIPPYGNVNANAIFRVYPNTGEHRYGENAQFVSADLFITISHIDAASDDQKSIMQNIRLYQLTKTLYYDTVYYNTSVTKNDYDPVPICLPGVTYNGADTLRIPLTEAYGKFLMSATDNEMDSLTPFYAKYKGFVLAVDSSTNGNEGRINTLSIADMYLTVRYKTEAGKDTSFFYYGDYACAFSTIQHSSSSLANYTKTFPDTQNKTVYLEGLAGVKPVINLLSIRDSINAMLVKKNLRPEQLLINKAEIVLSIPPGSSMGNYPAKLALFSPDTDDSGKPLFKFIDDFYGVGSDGTNPYFGGNINRSLMTYSFNISSSIQRILQQKDNVTIPSTYYVMPVAHVLDMYNSYHYIVDVTNYKYGTLLGTGSDLPVKLNLIYTILP